MVTQLLTSGDHALARAFIEAQGLSFEPGFDDLVGAFEGGALVEFRDGSIIDAVRRVRS